MILCFSLVKPQSLYFVYHCSVLLYILVINITLPDEKSNYVHRIGRVGRAERMGLAISLVSSVPEKVWYHGEWCSSRGRNCWNTRLTDEGGCCIWFNEPRVSISGHPLTIYSKVLFFKLNNAQGLYCKGNEIFIL